MNYAFRHTQKLPCWRGGARPAERHAAHATCVRVIGGVVRFRVANWGLALRSPDRAAWLDAVWHRDFHHLAGDGHLELLAGHDAAGDLDLVEHELLDERKERE